MRDTARCLNVAVKQMPNWWFRSCHSEFVLEHPAETELPWTDIGCVRFLNMVGFEFACSLLGVYRDNENTYVVTSLASEGDLFSWCEVPQNLPAAAVNREALVHPLATQLLKGVRQLHDYGIVHRDISLENVLLHKDADGVLLVRIIDFGMASTTRYFKKCITGKASYQAPELHSGGQYDAFLSDAFSLGVTLYAILVQDYPWLSTRPGGCKCFEYVRKHGFFQYLEKRKLRNSDVKVGKSMSTEVKQLLAGLLAFNPDERLTLGEQVWGTEAGGARRSVWDHAWLTDGPQANHGP
jgi:serine/threonine protein kinase